MKRSQKGDSRKENEYRETSSFSAVPMDNERGAFVGLSGNLSLSTMSRIGLVMRMAAPDGLILPQVCPSVSERLSMLQTDEIEVCNSLETSKGCGDE
jgi:hypothetical protein